MTKAQKQGAGKRKADAAPQQPSKKAKETPKQQQQQQQSQAPSKKQGKKQPEPESESEDEEPQGEVNEAGLKALQALESQFDAVETEMEELDDQMNSEIFQIQKKFIGKKKPLMSKRDALLSKLPGLWQTLLSSHNVIAPQLEEVDHEMLTHLIGVSIDEQFSKTDSTRQQIVGVKITFEFNKGSKHIKAGKYEKEFTFNDEKEQLECVPSKDAPFVDAAKLGKGDSFFHSWFTSEGEDDGILAAQDVIGSELYQEPLTLYQVACSGGDINQVGMEGDSDDEEGMMMFGGDSDDDEDDDEAPQLVDDEE